MTDQPEISYCERQARSIEQSHRSERRCGWIGIGTFIAGVAALAAAMLLQSGWLAGASLFLLVTGFVLFMPWIGLSLYQESEQALAEKWRAMDRRDDLNRLQAEDLRNFRLGRTPAVREFVDAEHRAAIERARREAAMPIEEWIARHS